MRWCLGCAKAHAGAVSLHKKRKKCEGCGLKGRSYKLPSERKARWCADCGAAEGAVSVRKQKMCEGCGLKPPTYGLASEGKLRWCSGCSKGHAGAVDPSKRKKCEDCQVKRPHFGLPTEGEKRWCGGCAKAHTGPVDLVNKSCAGCGLKAAAYGLPSEGKARWCAGCGKAEGAVHIGRCRKRQNSQAAAAPRRPRWTPEQTPRSHQTPDQTPRADQTAMGTTPHRHLEDRILDSLQRSTYRFGRILALTRPELNSLFSGDHASGGLDVALGVLSSKNEVHFGVGTGGCPIVVLGPIPEVAKRESKVTCRLRQARFLGFVGSGSAIHRGKQAGDKRQSSGGKQQVESESKNSPSNVRPTSGTTGVADNELGGNNGSAGNKLMDNDGNVRQYDSTAAAAACALHGDHARRRHMARTKQLGTTSAATTIGEAEDWTAPRSDLRLPQELSQPISGTQSTEAEQHSEIICQNCQKPHCKLKGKCVKRAPSRVKVWNLLAGATDELQVVDAGMGAEIKRLVALEQEIWMQVPVWGARDSYCLRFRT